MILLLLAGVTLAQQFQHDAIERQIESQLRDQKEAIMEYWPRVDREVAADFEKAEKCYVNFHLWKTIDCQAYLSKVDRDLSLRRDSRDRIR